MSGVFSTNSPVLYLRSWEKHRTREKVCGFLLLNLSRWIYLYLKSGALLFVSRREKKKKLSRKKFPRSKKTFFLVCVLSEELQEFSLVIEEILIPGMDVL